VRNLVHGHRLILRAFGVALPFLNWAFLLCGLAGIVGTASGILPPFSHSWWAKITTCLLWALFAREGYEPLAEDAP
jgi:hypothetical protein